MQRTIFIGDVHGCLHELQKMIDLLQPKKKDHVILLGDMINRGPEPAGVVEFVKGKKFSCVLGNHEEHYLQNWKKKDQYKILREKIGFRLHSWLKKLPLYIQKKNFIAVHAGLQPNTKISKGKSKVLLNIRTWDGKGDNLSHPANPPWYDFYTGECPVFYGHWASQGLCIRKNTFGLDSGCVYGGELSAYILEEKQLVQVKSAKSYAKRTRIKWN